MHQCMYPKGVQVREPLPLRVPESARKVSPASPTATDDAPTPAEGAFGRPGITNVFRR